MEDVKVNVKIKLSALWVTLVFFYLYNDVISFFRQDTIEEVLTGEMAGIQITPEFLVAAAILMAIPIFMIFLSLILPAKVNRWVNIILGIFHAVVLGTSLLTGAPWAYYALYMIFEALIIVLIVWHAWKWPKQEA
jgi:preprotein translocase subunit Sec61beta